MHTVGEDYSDAPVQAEWSEGGLLLDEHVELFVGNPNACYFSGEFCQESDNGSGIFFGLRVADPEMRQRSIGTRLVSALAYIAVSRNTSVMKGGVESQHVIKILRNLFGEENLTFYDVDPTSEACECVELPITTAEAIEYLEGYEQQEDDLEHRGLGFGVSVNLAHTDIESLEKPVELRDPLHSL